MHCVPVWFDGPWSVPVERAIDAITVSGPESEANCKYYQLSWEWNQDSLIPLFLKIMSYSTSATLPRNHEIFLNVEWIFPQRRVAHERLREMVVGQPIVFVQIFYSFCSIPTISNQARYFDFESLPSKSNSGRRRRDGSSNFCQPEMLYVDDETPISIQWNSV